MTDGTGREIDYLRISVTDRCNLRCVYCMPADGFTFEPHDRLLTFGEIARVVRAAAGLGIRRVKLTGGEPLMREGCVRLVGMLKAIPGIGEVTMTTNGVLLGEHLPELAAAGLDAVNISLDTLDPERSAALTRTPMAWDPRGTMDAAAAAGLRVKVNCVPVEEYNGGELAALAELARERAVDVRFIELMPIGPGKGLTAITGDEVKRRIEAVYGEMSPWQGRRGNGPAVYYSLPGFTGKIGFISALSRGFCPGCNRVRLTGTGFLKLCLHYDIGVSLRELIRSGAGDAELSRVMEEAIRRKPLRHGFGGGAVPHEDRHTMSQIGG